MNASVDGGGADPPPAAPTSTDTAGDAGPSPDRVPPLWDDDDEDEGAGKMGNS